MCSSDIKVDRLADFDSRLAYLKEYQPTTEIQSILNELERGMLPAVVAMTFEHNAEDDSVMLIASTDTFKTLAQQVQAFAGEGSFDKVRVSDISRNDEGRLVFTVTAHVTGVKQ